MGALNDLLHGFAVALTPMNLLYALIGVMLGTAIGVLPGIGPAMAIALLLPITYGLDEPLPAIIMFAGIYYGGMYGGSTTSILLNTPGESASVITAIEGNKMAKAGRGAQALATAAIGSFVAGTIGTMLRRTARPLGGSARGPIRCARSISPSWCSPSSPSRRCWAASRVRGFASLLVGLTIGLVGIDFVTGQQRLTFGIPQLADGIDVVVVAVGSVRRRRGALDRRTPAPRLAPGSSAPDGARMGREDWARSWKPWLRGTAIGFPFGSDTGRWRRGADIPLLRSREEAHASSPEEFGHGAIEGVAGPEATNNASAAGGLVPLLTLGLPTTATAGSCCGVPAVRHPARTAAAAQRARTGVGSARQPADRQRRPAGTEPSAGPDVGQAAAHPPAVPLRGHPVLRQRRRVRGEQSTVDLMVLFVLGVLGFVMRRYGLPVVPAIIGVILGPRAETQMRRALQISDGEISGLFNTAFSVTVYAIIALHRAVATRQSDGRTATSPPAVIAVDDRTCRAHRNRAELHRFGRRRSRRKLSRIRTRPTERYTMTIVVGYVPRPEGRAALRRAVAEATLRGESLLVVNAARGDAYADSAFAPDEDLEAVRSDLGVAGIEFEVRRLVRGNDPADEVIDAAAESGASLIVIGLRHRSPIGKLFLGSTSQQIVLEAACPVLAVKADDVHHPHSS